MNLAVDVVGDAVRTSGPNDQIHGKFGSPLPDEGVLDQIGGKVLRHDRGGAGWIDRTCGSLAPMHLVATRQIAAPAERVWALLTDLEASPRVMSGIDAVEIISGPPDFGVGTRWRETRTMLGRQATEELEVTDVTVGRAYSAVTDGNGTRYEVQFLIEPDGSGACTITTTFGATPTSLVSRVLSATLGRLFVGSSRDALEQDLADLAAAAEDHTS